MNEPTNNNSGSMVGETIHHDIKKEPTKLEKDGIISSPSSLTQIQNNSTNNKLAEDAVVATITADAALPALVTDELPHDAVLSSSRACRCGCVPKNIFSLFEMAEMRKQYRLAQQMKRTVASNAENLSGNDEQE